jgi:hypothetical protein
MNGNLPVDVLDTGRFSNPKSTLNNDVVWAACAPYTVGDGRAFDAVSCVFWLNKFIIQEAEHLAKKTNNSWVNENCKS